MLDIYYSDQFVSELRDLSKRDPKLVDQIDKSLNLVRANPRHHSLRTHKLKGKMNLAWSISINRSQRIIFMQEQNVVTLICFGTHDQVYR